MKAFIHQQRNRSLAGYSLIEMVVSLFTVSVLSVGLSSSLYLATKGLASSDVTRSGFESTTGLASLSADLREAKTITQYTSTDITATVSDRTGDGVDDQIQYTWSGSAGAPLLRRINGGPSRVVVPSTRAIDIDSRIETKSTPSGTITSNNVVHSQTSNTSTSDLTVNTTNNFGQYCYPTLPASTTAWRPTTVSLSLSKDQNNTSGTMSVSLFRASPSGWPTGSIVGTGTLNLASWNNKNYAMRDVSITATGTLLPTEGVTIVLSFSGVPNGRSIQIQTTSGGSASGLMSSTSGSSIWTQDYTQEMRHTLTASTDAPATSINTRRIAWLRVQVQTEGSTSLTKPISAEFLNRPIVP
jgi:hypothetical protein